MGNNKKLVTLMTVASIVCVSLVVLFIVKMDIHKLKILPQSLRTFSFDDRDNNQVHNVIDALKQNQAHNDIIPYPPANAKKYLIYRCISGLCGGLSDREKGMVISYIIAYITDRKFGIEVRIPDDNCTFPSFFDKNKITWDLKKQELAGLSSMEIKRIDNKVFITKLQAIDFDELFKTDIVYFKANLHYWNSLLKNENYREKLSSMANLTENQIFVNILPRILPLGDKLQRRLDDFLLIARPRKNSRLVCGQIREKKNPMDLEGARGILLFLQSFLSNKNNRIFIASDTPIFRDLAAEMFQKQYVNVTRTILHVERLAHASNICRGYEMAILEQRILSECDVLLITFSGYGRLAAYIRNKNEDLYCYKSGLIKPCRTEEMLKVYGIPNK